MRMLDTFLRDKKGIALVRECGLSHPTAYKIVRRVQEIMDADVPLVLSGTCEVDATYIGGQWKNKRIHIRVKGTKRGRGTKKQCIFGIAGRDDKIVRVFLVSGENIPSTRHHITSIVAKGSRICSDECSAYTSLPRDGYIHEFVNHSEGEYVRGDAHTQTLDGFWGNVKNFLADKGGVRASEIHRFIAEYVWRYNHRHMTRNEQAKRLLELLMHT
jgi:hypothetical protein